MKNKIMVIIFSPAFLIAVVIVQLAGCGSINKKSNPKVSAYENAKFEHGEDVYNNEENKEIRAEKLAEEEAQKAAEIKNEEEAAQDKGEGQVKVKF